MSTAIKHPVPEWVKPSFVMFDTRAHSDAQRQSVPGAGCQKLQMTA